MAILVSAFMALHLENIAHAVISFAVALVALSALYFYVEAPFAAIFQLVVGAGTIAVFLLAGEMLSSKGEKAQRLGSKLAGAAFALLISVPSILLDLEKQTFAGTNNLSFYSALWESRAADIVGQGVVILTLAIGAAMVLKRGRKQGKV